MATPSIVLEKPSEKSARLSFRIRPAVKERVDAAAQLLGQSITDFAETALEEKAKAVLSENERIVLSEHAFNGFLVAISGAPDKSSEKLLNAVAIYNRHEPVSTAKAGTAAAVAATATKRPG